MYSTNDHKSWMLVSLKLAAEADEPALKELEELINTDPALGDCFQVLEAWWNMKPAKDARAFDLFFEKLLNRLPAGK